MKKTIGIFLFLFASQLSAQNIQIETYFSLDKVNRTDIIYSPDVFEGYRLLSNKNNFTSGIRIQKKLRNKIQFVSGLTYQARDIEGFYSCSYCSFSPDANFVSAPSIRKQRFLSIPMVLNFRTSEKRFSLNLNTGVHHNFGIVKAFDIQNTYFLEGQIGFGFDYQVTKRWSINSGYAYRFALTNIYGESEAQPNATNYEPNKLRTNSFSLGLAMTLN